MGLPNWDRVARFLKVMDKPGTVEEIGDVLRVPTASAYRLCRYLEHVGLAVRGPDRISPRAGHRPMRTYVRAFVLTPVGAGVK